MSQPEGEGYAEPSSAPVEGGSEAMSQAEEFEWRIQVLVDKETFGGDAPRPSNASEYYTAVQPALERSFMAASTATGRGMGDFQYDGDLAAAFDGVDPADMRARINRCWPEGATDAAVQQNRQTALGLMGHALDCGLIQRPAPELTSDGETPEHYEPIGSPDNPKGHLLQKAGRLTVVSETQGINRTIQNGTYLRDPDSGNWEIFQKQTDGTYERVMGVSQTTGELLLDGLVEQPKQLSATRSADSTEARRPENRDAETSSSPSQKTQLEKHSRGQEAPSSPEAQEDAASVARPNGGELQAASNGQNSEASSGQLVRRDFTDIAEMLSQVQKRSLGGKISDEWRLQRRSLDRNSPVDANLGRDLRLTALRKIHEAQHKLAQRRGKVPGPKRGGASGEDLEEYRLKDPHPGSLAHRNRVRIGEGIAAPPRRSVLLMGITGSGKSEVIKHNVAEWVGPVFNQSITPDVIAETIDQRVQYGPVAIFAPYGFGKKGSELDQKLSPYVATFSPLAFVHDYSSAKRTMRWLREGTGSEASSSSNEHNFWSTLGESLGAEAMLAESLNGGNMPGVVSRLKKINQGMANMTNPDTKAQGVAELTNILESAIAGTDDAEVQEDIQVALDGLKANTDGDPRMINSIVTTTRQLLDTFDDTEIRKATRSSEIDPWEIVKNRGTLYVYAEADDMDRAAPIFTMLQELMTKATTEQSAGTGEPPKYSTLMAVDEIAHGAAMAKLATHFATGRRKGLQFLVAAQSPEQVEKKYGPEGAHDIFHQAIDVTLKGADPQWKKYLIERAGTTEITTPNTGKKKETKGSVLRGDREVTRTKTETEEPHEVNVLRGNVDFPKKQGQALVMTDNGQPFTVRIPAYAKNPHARELRKKTQKYAPIAKTVDEGSANRGRITVPSERVDHNQPRLEPGRDPEHEHTQDQEPDRGKEREPDARRPSIATDEEHTAAQRAAAEGKQPEPSSAPRSRDDRANTDQTPSQPSQPIMARIPDNYSHAQAAPPSQPKSTEPKTSAPREVPVEPDLPKSSRPSESSSNSQPTSSPERIRPSEEDTLPPQQTSFHQSPQQDVPDSDVSRTPDDDFGLGR
jgi:type IV secretory pathway TraG/TraD family ATPase VirD4